MGKPVGSFIAQDRKNTRLPEVCSSTARERIQGVLELREGILLPRDLGATDTAPIEYLFSTWGMPALTQEQIAQHLPNLKAVFYAAGSVQGFARPFLRSGVQVFSAWAANAVPVAEYTVAQIILANKGFYQASRAYKQEQSFERAQPYLTAQAGNFGAKVGILGVGMIGRMVLERLAAFDLTSLAYDAFLDPAEIRALGAEPADLDTIFSTCDVISNHIGNNPQTQGMFTYAHFGAMKQSATFINTGRGQQVVEADLVRALREQPGRTAVLDVTWPEPVPEGSPLYALPNAVLTPHIAGSACREVERMGLYMVQEMESLLSGRPTRYQVTEAMLATMA